jgi:hypothetical protein
MTEFKLGKQPAAPLSTDFKFADFAATIDLPSVPSRFGHGTAFADWKMLGNDQYGDCVWAGAAHEHMLLNKVVQGVEVPFDDNAVLGDYAAATGFNPTDPSTDKGTNVHDALDYRRKTGIADANGTRHQIGAYVSLDPKNWEHLRQAAYIFGACGIGFRFPNSAWAQFNSGKPWDVVANDGGNDGGHYVPVMGAPSADKVAVVTWARRQEMTKAFYEKYNDESWVYITPEELNGNGSGLHGFDIQKLNSFLSALRH